MKIHEERGEPRVKLERLKEKHGELERQLDEGRLSGGAAMEHALREGEPESLALLCNDNERTVQRQAAEAELE